MWGGGGSDHVFMIVKKPETTERKVLDALMGVFMGLRVACLRAKPRGLHLAACWFGLKALPRWWLGLTWLRAPALLGPRGRPALARPREMISRRLVPLPSPLVRHLVRH